MSDSKASKEKVPNFQEWLEERKNYTNDSKVRAQAYYDTSDDEHVIGRHSNFSWIVGEWLELNRIYDALGWVDNQRSIDDTKIMQRIADTQKQLDLFFRTLLGLDESATEEDVKERAMILGNTVQYLHDEAIENAEKQKKLLDELLGTGKDKEKDEKG